MYYKEKKIKLIEVYYSQPSKVPQTEAQIMSTAVLVNILVFKSRSAGMQVHWGVNKSVELHMRQLLSIE